MKKELIAKTLREVTAPEGQGPAPTGVRLRIFGLCRPGAYCYPAKEFGTWIDETANANDVITSMSGFMFMFWFYANDSNANAIQNALRDKWRTTGSPL